MLKAIKLSLANLLRLHRYLGLSVAVIAIHLSVTGILLNHTNDLGLDQSHVNHQGILKWYGITQPENLTSYKLNDHWITQWNDSIYFDSKVIHSSAYQLKGATTSTHFNVLATTEEIWLLTIDGEIIERLSAPAEKLGDVDAVSQIDGRVVIQTERGIFISDKDLISWQPLEKTTVNWAEQQVLPKSILQDILDSQHSISWERLLLDVHSGRIFGAGGVAVIDLAGVLLLLLSISGVIIWFKRRRRRQV